MLCCTLYVGGSEGGGSLEAEMLLTSTAQNGDGLVQPEPAGRSEARACASARSVAHVLGCSLYSLHLRSFQRVSLRSQGHVFIWGESGVAAVAIQGSLVCEDSSWVQSTL